MARKKKRANIVGPQLRRLRIAAGLTQEELAGRCQLQGFDISRGTLSQIEAQIRCVIDEELVWLARALGTSIENLFQKRL